ncbi:MAG: CHAT domain-containing tetratricopeptide repeat protein [Chloroflexota bacterium]
MLDNTRLETLVNHFKQAANLEQFDRCNDILRELRTYALDCSELSLWIQYLEGILAFEKHNDWAAAENTFQSLLHFTFNPHLKTQTLYGLGRTHIIQGEWTNAITLYQQIVATAHGPQKHGDTFKALRQIAICLCKGYLHGDYNQEVLAIGIAHCQEAIAICSLMADEIQDPESVAWLTGSVYSTLGTLYLYLQDWERAIQYYRKELRICHENKDILGIACCHNNMGEVNHLQGEAYWSTAQDFYKKALIAVRQSENQLEMMDILANLASLYEQMEEYPLAIEYYVQSIQCIEALRSKILAIGIGAGFSTTVANIYANAIVLNLEFGDTTCAFNHMEQARSRAFLDTLVAGSLDISPDKERRISAVLTLEGIQAALPENTLVLAYFTTGLVQSPEGRGRANQIPRRHRFPASKVFLVGITREQFIVHTTNLSPNDLLSHRIDRLASQYFLEPSIRATLYEELISPVEGLLAESKLVCLIPHGPLHYVPFQALTSGEEQCLLSENGPKILYSPSVSTLLHEKPRSDGRLPSPSCLAVGYNGDTTPALTFAEHEAADVARIMQGQVLVGAAPKKQALEKRAEAYRFLHFSCHGTFNVRSPLDSMLQISATETLTAREVMQTLKLNCQLVTLSACHSGLSAVRSGDELSGFAQAFMQAGAEAVLVSLWQIPEHSTRILIERFYEEVCCGVDIVNALKKAQLYLRHLTVREIKMILRRYSDARYISELASVNSTQKPFVAPYYWAGFTLIGRQSILSP